MDADHFDRLARSLSVRGTRRRLVRLLATLPLSSVLPSLSGAARTRGRDRGKRTHTEACIPTGQTCPSPKPRGQKRKQLRCKDCCQGFVSVEANGKRRCGCTPNGMGCGAKGAAGCCSGSCQGGVCQASVAACTPRTGCSPPRNCGSIDNGCGTGTISCGGPCSGSTPICVGNVCTACSAANPCPGGLCCDAATGQCLVNCPICQTCDGSGQCVADLSQNGTPCGVQNQPGGGVTRCCNGTCPDPPCLPRNQPCATDANCRAVCCTGGPNGICPDATPCICRGDPPRDPCGSDNDCDFGQGRCVCGTCCVGPGGFSDLCSFLDPRECCSGVCGDFSNLNTCQ